MSTALPMIRMAPVHLLPRLVKLSEMSTRKPSGVRRATRLLRPADETTGSDWPDALLSPPIVSGPGVSQPTAMNALVLAVASPVVVPAIRSVQLAPYATACMETDRNGGLLVVDLVDMVGEREQRRRRRGPGVWFRGRKVEV